MRSHEPFQNESADEIDLCHLKQGCMHVMYMYKGTYRIAGNFRGVHFSWISSYLRNLDPRNKEVSTTVRGHDRTHPRKLNTVV